MRTRIYLDNLSTTAVDPRVLEAMRPFFRERFGHPASRAHADGWDAQKAVETARAQVADLIGAAPAEVVFTSGATEADNLAIKGVAEALASKGRHLVTTAIENRPVRDSAAWLEARGWEVTRVAPDGDGRIAPADVAAAVREDTVIVSVQMANHEVGTRQDLRAIAAALEGSGALLHTDASGALAWVPLAVRDDGVHLASISGNKIFGPKGIGALYVRRRKPRVRIAAQVHGGGHERGLRAGTVDVPGAVGLGAAAELVRTEGADDARRAGALRDALESGLRAHVPGTRILAGGAPRLPNVAAVAFEAAEAEALLVALPSVSLAAGSACTSATVEPSYVLPAMGVPAAVAATTVRFSLGRDTTREEIDAVVPLVAEAVANTRALDPRRSAT
jgi:cysteine desulfurase